MHKKKQNNSLQSESGNAHANFRHGLSDYHDGSSLGHQLGNDEYEGNNLPDEIDKNQLKFNGRIALGNEYLEEID